MWHLQGCPPVDLLIRTSGESRLSDFLLYQSSYALLHFVPVLWPDFSLLDFLRAIVSFQTQFGHLKRLREQPKFNSSVRNAVAVASGLQPAEMKITAAERETSGSMSSGKYCHIAPSSV